MKNKKKSTFRGKVNKDAQRQKASGSFKYLNMPKGLNLYSPTPGSKEKFDIIPYTITSNKHMDRDESLGIAMKGELWYKKPYRLHRNVGGDNALAVCLSTFGEKCPICEYRKKRAAEGADKEELQAYNASLRNLYLVIPREIKKVEEDVHLMDISQHLFQVKLNEELNEDEDYEIFPDIEEGLTLQVRWTEETFAGNKYAEAGRIDFLKRKSAIDEELLESLPDLDSVLKKYTYDELKSLFFGIDDEDDEDEDETPKSKKKSQKDDEDEDEDEDEDDETIEEDGDELPFDEDEDENSHKKSKDRFVPKDTRGLRKNKKNKTVNLTWEDLNDMDIEELVEVAEANKLDIDPDDDDEEGILKSKNIIAKELGIEIPTKKSKPDKKKSQKDEDETPKSKKSDKSNKCPHGHKFGVDTDDFDECDDCNVWDKCIDKKEGK